MLETRLSDGIDLVWLKSKGFARAETVSGLLAEGLVEGKEVFVGLIKLTLKGRLLADHVVRELLD
jgi:oxygen-independent coproporphyrinogen-3 oxidase